MSLSKVSYMDDLAHALKVHEVQKSAFTTSDFVSGALSHEEAEQFIVEVVNESRMLQLVRRQNKTDRTGDLAFLDVSGNITEKATENTDSGNTRKPTTRELTYTTEKSRSALDITGEVIEDNVEGEEGRETIMNAILARIANDMETLAIQGDEDTVGSDDLSRLLKINDGWIKLTGTDDGAHLVSANNKRASWDLLNEMVGNLPSKWMNRLTTDYRFWMNWDSVRSIVKDEAARTTDLGDTFRRTGALPPILGVPTEIVPLMPSDLSLSGTDSLGTTIFLAMPSQFIFIVQRDIQIEWERMPRADRWESTIHMRTDFLVEQPDSVVRATDVIVDLAATAF